MRPERLIVVLGTGTDVGKTWVTARVLARLKAGGTSVSARKPVQSFVPCDPETDADLLGLATGESPDAVCPRHRWYAMPMAPPIAAAFLGVAPPSLGDLIAELEWPAQQVGVGMLETVGGPRSPLSADGDSAALAAAVDADLAVLVAPAGLGAINAVRLSAPTIPDPVVVFLNHFDGSDLHDRNLRWLQAEGFNVVTSVADLASALRSLAAQPPRHDPADRDSGGGREKAAGRAGGSVRDDP